MDGHRDPTPTPAPRRATTSRKRHRGIFAKLVIVFLVIGLVPFLGVSFWTYHKAKGSMTEEVIEYWLVRLAREGGIQIDQEVQGMREQVLAWATDETLAADIALIGDGTPDPLDPNLLAIRDFLRHRQRSARDVDLILLLRGDGCILASSLPAEGEEASSLVGSHVQKILPDTEGPPYYAERQWITEALQEDERDDPLVLLDCHVSRLREIARGEPHRTSPVWPKDPRAFSFGFARPISVPRLGQLGQPTTRGVLVVLYNWARIHDLVDAITARFQNRVEPRDADEAAALEIANRYKSGYPFLFADDMDTVIGHRYLKNLGNSLSISHGHPKFRALMTRARDTSTPFGTYAYEYPEGTPKISGFALTRPRAEGGFGWSLGVGINGDQIYKSVRALRTLMTIAALIVVGMVLLLAAIFSHRITEPITRLISYTSEVARGNLDARVHIGTKDEIEVLADSFNEMVEDLKETNLRLIQAEKDAAWREMARQVAHEIKNPLTPIVLAAQQVRRAHIDRHPRFDEILEDSLNHIIQQSESLKRIAADFADFAALPRQNLEKHDLAAVVRNAVAPYQGDQDELEVALDVRTPQGLEVVLDEEEIRRAFLNLLNNALEAMAGKGSIFVTLDLDAADPPMARIAVRDTGPGIPAEDRPHLFEPYFSTRSGGTGLGLAICKKIMTEHGGRIEVESDFDTGTTFTLYLPVAE